MKSSYIKVGKTHILYDADALNHAGESHFETAWWRQQDALVGSAQGRGRTVFVRNGDEEYVLRHYRRGGLIAYFSDDCYIWTGLEHSRPWREWQLLRSMYEKGLPVPQPVAVRVQQHGFCYRADILMQRIPALSLSQQLFKGRLEPACWQAIGACIRRFHDADIYHADLNAHNILLAPDDVIYLIDFDRGEERGGDKEPAWRQANLNRLLRSLRKLAQQHLEFNFHEDEWAHLLDGYRGESASGQDSTNA